MLGFVASRGEEFDPGLVIGLIIQSFLCNNILLKYETKKASDIDIRGRQKGCPLASFEQAVIYLEQDAN